MNNKLCFVEEELNRRESVSQFRSLRNIKPLTATQLESNQRIMVNFSSNDYLGLAKHPLLIERAAEYAHRYGAGSTASRLICGSLEFFDTVEKKLAALKGTEACLIMNSGYQGNVAVIPTLVDANSLILSDRLNHSSIINGIALSGCDKAIYQHNNLAHLEMLLKESAGKYTRRLIITESVFSMDGDCSDIDGLAALALQYDAILMVDEAHATGVLGNKGMGLTAGKAVDVVLGTFGKAFGSFGAYVGCSSRLRDYLINCCPGFVYSTALPPTVLGAVDAALELVPTMEPERRQLQARAADLRQALQALGYETQPSSTQIVPVMIGGEKETLALAAKLEAAGFLATAIRPPTVPAGKSRIRIALSAAHTDTDIAGLLSVFEQQQKAPQ